MISILTCTLNFGLVPYLGKLIEYQYILLVFAHHPKTKLTDLVRHHTELLPTLSRYPVDLSNVFDVIKLPLLI